MQRDRAHVTARCRANLYTMPAAGGAPRQLTFLNALSIGGVWSPDARSIAFASDEGGLACGR